MEDLIRALEGASRTLSFSISIDSCLFSAGSNQSFGLGGSQPPASQYCHGEGNCVEIGRHFPSAHWTCAVAGNHLTSEGT